MALSYSGQLSFYLSEIEAKVLELWLSPSGAEFLVKKDDSSYTLTISTDLTKDYSMMEELGLFINNHGKFLEGEVYGTNDCDTEYDLYVVEDGKMKIQLYQYDEKKKSTLDTLGVFNILEKVDKINNTSSKNVDDVLVDEIHEVWYIKEEIYPILTTLVEQVMETDGLVKIFVESGRIDILPDGIFYVPYLPETLNDLGSYFEMSKTNREQRMYLPEMKYDTEDNELAKISINGIYYPFERDFISPKVQLKTLNNTWVSACELCERRLESVINNGCKVCIPRFVDKPETIELRTLMKN